MNSYDQGVAPCGKKVETDPAEYWKAEITCRAVGCMDCRYHEAGSIIHIAQDTAQAVSIWARKMREMRNEQK